jgi:hypothetical protein
LVKSDPVGKTHPKKAGMMMLTMADLPMNACFERAEKLIWRRDPAIGTDSNGNLILPSGMRRSSHFDQ